MTYRMIHFTKVSCFVGDKMKILFISLGCDKNLVDSEHMIGLLEKAGYEFTSDETSPKILSSAHFPTRTPAPAFLLRRLRPGP